MAITLDKLIEHYRIPHGYLDKQFTDEHVREFALLLDSWELLGSHLGLSKQQIEAIKVDNDRHEVRKESVLIKWKEVYAFHATYRKMLEVLLSIDRKDLACSICELFTSKKATHGDQDPSHQLTQLSPPQFHEPSYERVLANFATIADIEDAFRDLVVDIEEYFEGNVPLVKLQRYSCHLPVSLKGQFGQLFEGKSSRIWNAKTVGELFMILSYFWDYLHPDLLYYLVKRFGTKETIDLVSGYVKELSKFRQKVKIPDYIGERRINLVEDDYTPIIAILGDEWCEKTLADLEEVRCDFSKKFSFLRLLPKMNGLKYDSIALIFSVPKSVQFDNDELCEFFRSYNVLKLTVGEECIYDDGDQQISGSEDQASADGIPVDTLEEGEEETVAAKSEKERSDDINSDSDDQDIEVVAAKGGKERSDNVNSDSDDQDVDAKESNESGGFSCDFVEKPPKLIQSECPVCLQIIREPYQVTCCGYSFCRVCIERLKTDNKHCPTCNEESIICYSNKGLQHSLYDFEVYCTHRAKGCKWTGELRQLEKHLNEEPQGDRELEGCLFTCVDCKFKSVGCEVKPAREDIPAHLKDHSEIHLRLLQRSKSSVDTACTFLETQEQIAKLSQQVVGVNRTVAEIKERYKREVSQLHRTTEHERKQHEQEVASLNSTLKILKEEYEQLQNQIHSQPPPLSPSQAFVGQTPVLGIGTPTPPVAFTLTNYDANKRDDMWWWSPPFYTHHHGYKMCLLVYSNGRLTTEEHGTHVSVYILLKRGEFDDGLKWPFRGDIVVSLLDQEDNKDHYSETIPFDDDTPDVAAGRVTEENTAERGCGYSGFISHNDLQPKYLKNDCLVFQITRVIIN